MSTKSSKNQKMLQKIFNQYDTDSNKYLSFQEFPQVINSLKQTMGSRTILSSEDIIDIFNTLDINCDEQISVKQFKRLITKLVGSVNCDQKHQSSEQDSEDSISVSQ